MNESERKERALWKYSCAFHTERMKYIERDKMVAGSKDWHEADKAWRAYKNRREDIKEVLLALDIVSIEELKNEEQEVRDEVKEYRILTPKF